MAIVFPSSPVSGQQFTVGKITWTYNGVSWDASSPGNAAPVTGSTNSVTTGNISATTAAAATTIMTIALPSAGTWQINVTVAVGLNVGQEAVFGLFDGTGTLVPNTETKVSYIAGVTFQSSTTGIFYVTTNGPVNYTIRAWGPGSTAGCQIMNGSDGRTSASWLQLTGGYVGSPGAMNYYTTTTAVATITATGQTVSTATFTSMGYPVYISLCGDANPTTAGENYAFIQFYRDGTAIGNPFIWDSSAQNINVSFNHSLIDTPAAGSHTYSVKTLASKSYAGSWSVGEAAGPQWEFIELAGATGTQGPQGVQGTSGVSGSQGTQGTIGTSGTQGATGLQGVQGASGGGGGSSTGTAIVSDTPPSYTSTGTLWYESDVGKLRLYYSGAWVDASPSSINASPIIASGFVNAGVDVQLGNLKARIPTSGNRSLQLSTVSGTYSVYGSDTYSAGGAGATTIQDNNKITITTTPTYINGGLNFTGGGMTDTWLLMDTGAGRAWRITLIVGSGYANNFISIEQLL